MNYIVYVTSSFNESINDGNFRGEGRWERNVLECLLSDGRQVYIINRDSKWNNKQALPDNLHDVSTLPKNESSLFISNSPPNNLDIPVSANYYLVQWVNGPDNGVENRFIEFSKNNKVLATCLFKDSFEHFKKFYGNLVRWVPGPAVPFVSNCGNFNKKHLSITSRPFELMLMHNKDSTSINIFLQFFSWITQLIKKDNSLKLSIVLGISSLSKNEYYDWFWSHPCVGPYKKFIENNTELLIQPGWLEILELYSKTKLMIYPIQHGGPPYETAMFGIPPIVVKKNNAYTDGKGNNIIDPLLECNQNLPDKSFINVATRVLNSKPLYAECSNIAKTFVKNHVSYGAYIKQIDDICKEMDWK